MKKTLKNFVEYFGNTECNLYVRGGEYEDLVENYDEYEEDIPGCGGAVWGLVFGIDWDKNNEGVPDYIKPLLDKEIDIVEGLEECLIINLQ